MTVGQRIAQKRKELGLSQESLGEQLGVSRQAIYKWESDATLPEIEKLIALSRIFSVSVGRLLGVEDEAAAADPDSGELSETQLRMVREIVDGYLAAQPKPESPKRRRWPKVLGVAACIALIAVLSDLFSSVDEMRSQYASLSNSVGNVQYSVSSQLGSLTGRVEEILQSQNSLVANHSVEAAGVDPDHNTVDFTFRVIPKTYREGLTAWIDVEQQGERSTYGPYAAQDEMFSGRFTAPLSDLISVYIVFEVDGVRQTQLLETFYGLYKNTFPDVYLEAWPLVFGVDLKTGTLDEPLQADLSVSDSEGNPCSPEEAGIVSYRVGLFADRELVFWFAPGTRTVMSNGVQRQEDIFILEQEGFELERGKTYCIAAVIADRYGREYVIQDTPLYYREGDGWTSSGSYSTGPFSDGWSY